MSRAEWQRRHQDLKARAKRGKVDLLLLGDSITEAWPGTGKAAFDRHLKPLKAAAFGIGGDQTQHLLWRLQQGECEGLQPQAVALLIGINNFGHQDDSPAEVLQGIHAVAQDILARWPEAKLLLLGLLPGGDGPQDPERKRVAEANALMASLPLGPRSRYFESTRVFLREDGSLDRGLLPDGIHPNEAAYELWAQALLPEFMALLGR